MEKINGDELNSVLENQVVTERPSSPYDNMPRIMCACWDNDVDVFLHHTDLDQYEHQGHYIHEVWNHWGWKAPGAVATEYFSNEEDAYIDAFEVLSLGEKYHG